MLGNYGVSRVGFFPDMLFKNPYDRKRKLQSIRIWEKATSIDLDSNGGLAVYPNNIYNSSHTTILKYW